VNAVESTGESPSAVKWTVQNVMPPCPGSEPCKDGRGSQREVKGADTCGQARQAHTLVGIIRPSGEEDLEEVGAGVRVGVGGPVVSELATHPDVLKSLFAVGTRSDAGGS